MLIQFGQLARLEQLSYRQYGRRHELIADQADKNRPRSREQGDTHGDQHDATGNLMRRALRRSHLNQRRIALVPSASMTNGTPRPRQYATMSSTPRAGDALQAWVPSRAFSRVPTSNRYPLPVQRLTV
jgi:hypothetical protein